MVAIDDVPLAGKDLRDVTDMLRGAPGTKVKVTFERDGVPTKLDAIIERKQVRLRDVPLATMIGPPSDGLAYVQVRSFAMNTKQEVVNALDKLQAATPEKKLRAVILDLRGNPGGASALLLLPRRCCCCCLCGSVLLDAGVRVGECAGCCSFGDCYAFFSFLAEALSGMISLALALCRSALSPSLPPPPPPRSLSHAHTHPISLSLATHSLADCAGLLSSAVGVAEVFVPKGTQIVETRGRDSTASAAARLSQASGLESSSSPSPSPPAPVTDASSEPTGPGGCSRS